MNICIATSSFPLNRSEIYHRYLDDLVRILQSKGHTISILTQEKRGEKEKFIPNTEVVWFPWNMAEKTVLSEVTLANPRNIFSALSLIYHGVRSAKKITEEKKIDLFICLWIVPSGFYMYLKNIFLKKTPYILWSLGSDVYNNKDNFFTRTILRLIIRGSKVVFADGFELCEIIRKISGRECKFLPTFHKIDVLEISAADAAIHKQETTFLYIGRLSRVKGVDVLIQSLKILKEEKIKCYLIGDGEMMQDLANEVRKNKLEEKVVFSGKITDEKEKARYFNLADCIIIPSRSESIPVVLSEAVQYGKPIIATNAGDMELLVKKYKLGLTAEKGNAASLANAMKKFILEPILPDHFERKKLLEVLLFENNAQILLKEIQTIAT
jgi:glycosyltransferase involved in cell wall biosynthesis